MEARRVAVLRPNPHRTDLGVDAAHSERYLPGMTMMPMLADYIWIGGGTLGTILVIVLIVFLIRRA